MQREASIWCGATRASVGQASMQRVQVPQRSAAIGEVSAGRDGERGDDDAEQEPRAELLIDDAGVFADPADAGACGDGALDEGTGVDVAARLAGETLLQDGGFDVAEAGEELVVVVGGDELGGWLAGARVGSRLTAPGVAGDPAGVGRRGVDGERAGGVVVEGADDDGAGPRHRRPARRCAGGRLARRGA